MTLIYVMTALALVGLNAFFVATEFSIVKVRATRIEELASQGVKRAVAARHVIGDLNPYLSACQLGITLASLGLGWVGEPAFAHLFEPMFAFLGSGQGFAAHSAAVTTAFILITTLHVVLGELVPKTLAIDRPAGTALWVAWPIRWFYLALYPVNWAMNGISNVIVRAFGIGSEAGGHAHSEEELRMIVASSRQQGVLSETHASIVARALDFADHNVRQIIVPRDDVTFLDVNRTFEENLATARAEGHTRYPLCDGSLDKVLGIVHLKDVFVRFDEVRRGRDLRIAAREPTFVPETLAIEELMTQFQRDRFHMAIVVDEYGGTTGIVTLEDVIEELIGEIQDEFDEEEPKIRPLKGGRFSVDAALPLDEAHTELGLAEAQEDEEGVDTLGGLVMTRLGRMPRRGDRIEVGDHWIVIGSVRGRRILRLIVGPSDEADKSDLDGPDVR